MDDREAFMASVSKAYRRQKRIQKSDDIMSWIQDNWKIFCCRRSDMVAAMSQLGRQTSCTVDALCDLLGIPNNVYFKRSPVTDVGGTLLHFKNSKLFELFQKCKEASDNREACLFIIAGQKSICITNMQTSFELCNYDFWYRDEDNEIHIFNAKEAGIRLPNLFNREENYG